MSKDGPPHLTCASYKNLKHVARTESNLFSIYHWWLSIFHTHSVNTFDIKRRLTMPQHFYATDFLQVYLGVPLKAK